MGIYPIECPICRKETPWFNGNLDLRCSSCKEKDFVSIVSTSNGSEPVSINISPSYKDLCDSLKETIEAKDMLITYLEAEVARLKLSQTPTNAPQTIPSINTPLYPVNPNPFIPANPWQPNYPYPGYTIVTNSDSSGSALISGTSLPLGAVQNNTIIEPFTTSQT